MVATKAIRNSMAHLVAQVISVLFLLVTRGMFIRMLGEQMLGVEALFLDVVCLLSVFELGLQGGMVRQLSASMAGKDREKTAALIHSYQKAYQIIAFMILLLGLMMTGVVSAFVREGMKESFLSFVFFLYVMDAFCVYFGAQKKVVFLADRRQDIVSIYHVIGQGAFLAAALGALLIFRSLIAYLIVKILADVLENVLLGFHYRRHYGDLAFFSPQKLSKEERNGIFYGTKAFLTEKIVSISQGSIVSLMVSYFVNVVLVGIYSNYLLLIHACEGLIAHLFHGLSGCFGDFLFTPSHKHNLDSFHVLYFLNYIVISFASICFFILLEPFVVMWTGSANYVLPMLSVCLIIGQFYMYGMRQSIFLVRAGAGLYQPDKYFAILEAVLTIVFSLVFVQWWGLNGVLLSNLLSQMLVPFIVQPTVVCKYVLKTTPWDYYRRYLLYAGLTVGIGFVTYCAAGLIPFGGFAGFVLKLLVCLILPNAMNILIFHATREFQYLWALFKTLSKRFLVRG